MSNWPILLFLTFLPAACILFILPIPANTALNRNAISSIATWLLITPAANIQSESGCVQSAL